MKIYFDQYVRNALYDKGGYYHDHSSVKEKRDFITSPQVSDLFGFFVSRYISLNFSKFFKKKKTFQLSSLVQTMAYYPYKF